MDPITHTLFGASAAAAGLRRRSALATATLLIGANLPDIDILVVPFGYNLELRRGWTHGVLAMAVLPVLLWACMLAWHRWRRGRGPVGAAAGLEPGALLAIACLAVWSHPVLDFLNTYGVRLLMPFSDRWFYGDALFIVDPWVWLALGTAVWLGWRGRERLARGMVVSCAVYAVGMSALGRWSEALVARELAARGNPVARVLASPVPVDPTARRVIADLGDRYLYADVRPGRTPMVRVEDWAVATLHDHPTVLRAMPAPPIHGFLIWSRYPWFEILQDPRGTTVRVGDARYAERPGVGWATRAVRLPD
jgi:inner membrane protein